MDSYSLIGKEANELRFFKGELLQPDGLSDRDTDLGLIDMLKDLSDEAAWTRFHNDYRPMILNWMRQYGLNDADSDDAAQEVFQTLLKKMPVFRYDPSQQSFRGYLKVQTRFVLLKFFRKRRSLGYVELPPEIPDECDRDELLKYEWQRLCLEEAARRIRREADIGAYMIFRTAQENGTEETARMLRMNRQSIYNAVSSVKNLLREQVQILEKESW